MARESIKVVRGVQFLGVQIWGRQWFWKLDRSDSICNVLWWTPYISQMIRWDFVRISSYLLKASRSIEI